MKAGAAVALLLLAGCGGDGAPSPTPVSVMGDRASLLVSIPPPMATPIGDPVFPWAANFTVNLLEEAGIGVEITEIVVELTPPVVFDAAQITAAARGNRIAGRGSLAVPLSIAFEDPGLNARVVVRGVDDRSNPIEAFARLVVIPAQRP